LPPPSAQAPPGGLYYKLFGGDYGEHPKLYAFTVLFENQKHPITAGVEDFANRLVVRRGQGTVRN